MNAPESHGTSPDDGQESHQDKAPEVRSSKRQSVWFLTDGLSPISISLTRKLLQRGDCVAVGVLPEESNGPRSLGLKELVDEINDSDVLEDEIRSHDSSDGEAEQSTEAKKTWKDRFRVLPLDARSPGQTQATIAEIVDVFGRIDVLLLCRSEVLVGTVEELSQTSRTRSLVTEQFETNFFSAVTVIKLVLPLMRKRKNGHILALTGTTGHLGTPGLGMYCSSQWALEGYCDSLAYEIAPFNIRLTIVQPNIEVVTLTAKITSCPPLLDYSPSSGNQAPLAREILSRLLRKSTTSGASKSKPDIEKLSLTSSEIATVYPDLSKQLKNTLVAETVHVLFSIGGIDNPPARLIVGYDGIGSVKEKLRTVMEELEDFLGVSEQVDLPHVAAAAAAAAASSSEQHHESWMGGDGDDDQIEF